MTVSLVVDLKGRVPVYEQIRAQLAGYISTGALGPGDRLPTVRGLATDLGIAVNTVGRAYAELESAGLVSTKRRVGTIVTAADRAPIPGDVVEAADRLAAAVGSAGPTEQVAIAVLHAALRRNGSVGQSAPGDPANNSSSRADRGVGSDGQQPPQCDDAEHHDAGAQRYRGQSSPVVRADESTDQRAHGDETRCRPVDPVGRHQHVGGRGNQIYDQGEQILGRIHSLHGFRQDHAHCAHQQNPLRSREVAAVDPDQKCADEQRCEAAGADDSVIATGRLRAPPDGDLQTGLDDHQNQRHHEQYRNDFLEDAFRQMQQQPGTDDGAGEGCWDLPAEPWALALEFAAVSPGAGRAAGYQADRIRHGCRHWWDTEGDQGRKGHQGSGADDCVDDSGPDSGQEDDDDLERAQRSTPGSLRSAATARLRLTTAPYDRRVRAGSRCGQVMPELTPLEVARAQPPTYVD